MSDSDIFVDETGACLCSGVVEVQDTEFGCARALLPSGLIQRRQAKMAGRSQIMPGRPASPAF